MFGHGLEYGGHTVSLICPIIKTNQNKYACLKRFNDVATFSDRHTAINQAYLLVILSLFPNLHQHRQPFIQLLLYILRYSFQQFLLVFHMLEHYFFY